MKIDNSQVVKFWHCPLAWKERYANELEPKVRNTDSLDFGTRMHQLLENHHRRLSGVLGDVRFEPLPNEALESEAQLTFEGYCAHYPEEPFEIVDVEKYFEVPLPAPDLLDGQMDCKSGHIYNGEFDAVVRDKTSGKLKLLETKTESRSSKSNSPEAWISKSQVGLYQWAAEQIYGEEFEDIILNIIPRQSPKGNCAPLYRRDNLHRTREQQLDAVKNLVWVADQIEEMQRAGFFPSNRNNCVNSNGWRCDYFSLHITPEGRPSEELIQLQYKKPEAYLASGL